MAQANQADLLGEGLYDPNAVKPANDGTGAAPGADRAAALDKLTADAAKVGTGNARVNAAQGPSTTPQQMQQAFASGNVGGAAGANNAVSPTSQANYAYMHQLNQNPASVQGFLNQAGEKVGVSHAGSAALPNGGVGVQNPLTWNPLSAVGDPNKGLGTTAPGTPGGASGGRPLMNMTPETRQAAGAMTSGILPTAGKAVGNALNLGSGLNGAPGTFPDKGYVDQQMGLGNDARGLGADVLSGKQGAANPADAARQGDVLDQAMAFAKGNDQPSQAQLLLDQASQKNMADTLSIARSGRARDAGSQARALTTATAENASTGVDNARNAALLRQQEAQDFRNQQIQALTLGGNVAGQARSAGDTERGQSLTFDQGMNTVGQGLQTNALNAIPQLEDVRHKDQYELDPSGKLKLALLGAGGDVLSQFL